MQTFLPVANFRQSAAFLDRLRLGKQRVETLQLMKALNGFGTGWANHPAALMWRGRTCALLEYQRAMVEQWCSYTTAKGRPYVDTCWEKTVAVHGSGCARLHETVNDQGSRYLITPPWWLGDPDFHAAHRSNLLRKNPHHYSQFGWTEPDDLEYVWPEGE